jgi:cellulase (glycosyl hydrolase family 5)
MRWVLAALGVAAGIAAAVVLVFLLRGGTDEPVTLPRSAMPGRLIVGFQDDSSFRWAADRAESLDRGRDANATVIRTIVVWRDTAPNRPATPTDPFDSAYGLDDVDDLARNAQQRGIELLITIWGTPGWANGDETANHPPTDTKDLEAFAQALADRYSGRHAGYPAVRLFSAWNEPNLEQFLTPQFDADGESASPGLYAGLARAIHDGVKRGNPEALVAIGETSPRGHDRPSTGTVQDSHSPARFARLLSEERPKLDFDAWAQHPYPPRPGIAPAQPVRWPRVALGNLERFGEWLDEWFGGEGTPVWVTEYGHETNPSDPLGVPLDTQARFVDEALALADGNPRVRMLVWFILRDRPAEHWNSGLIAEDGSPKPALERFTEAAAELDARNPVLPGDADVARVPVLELAYYTPAGDPIEVSIEGEPAFSVPLGADGWVEIPLAGGAETTLTMVLTDAHGHSVERVVELST